MPSGIRFSGIKEFEAAITKIVADVEIATRGALVEGAHAAQLAMQEKANTGRHKKGEPTSAQHGSGPNVVTGNLRRSIRVGPIVSVGLGYATEVGPTAIYGRRVELEYGYPYTRPGLEAVLPLLPEIYARNWRRALSR